MFRFLCASEDDDTVHVADTIAVFDTASNKSTAVKSLDKDPDKDATELRGYSGLGVVVSTEGVCQMGSLPSVFVTQDNVVVAMQDPAQWTVCRRLSKQAAKKNQEDADFSKADRNAYDKAVKDFVTAPVGKNQSLL